MLGYNLDTRICSLNFITNEMGDLAFNDSNFEQEVLKSENLVMVDFWAVWCFPCKMLSPIIEEIAQENKELVKVGKVNVDESPNVSAKYQIMSIPTVMLFKGGEVVETFVGVQPKDAYVEAIKKHSA